MKSPEIEEQLPKELLLRDDGHGSDVALASIADGEHALVDTEVMEHVAACEVCSARLGNEALLSLSTTEACRPRPVARPRHAQPKVRFPWVAVAAGFAVVLAANVPAFSGAPDFAHAAFSSARIGVPLLARSAFALSRGAVEAPRLPGAVQWVLTAVFLSAGGFIALRASRKRSLEGGF